MVGEEKEVGRLAASGDRATDAPHRAPAGLGPDGSVSTGAGCDCLSWINRKLAEHNTVVLTTLFPPIRTVIETQKLDSGKRGRPIRALAAFCPFCGTKYPAAQAIEARRAATAQTGAVEDESAVGNADAPKG